MGVWRDIFGVFFAEDQASGRSYCSPATAFLGKFQGRPIFPTTMLTTRVN
jgi:hypothetical protein